MAEDSFLLINLKDSESKKLAQVISNDTSRKLLEYLTRKSGTETEIAKELKLPLSTVHYNLQHLAKAKLVDADEFHYSEKGKEVIHYSLSNKYIIIAPKASPKFLDSLKKIIPAVLIVGAAAGIMKVISFFTSRSYDQLGTLTAISRDNVVPAITESLAKGVIVSEEAIAAAPMVEDAITNTTQPIVQVVQPWITDYVILYFLAGALFAIAIYFMFELFSKRVK